MYIKREMNFTDLVNNSWSGAIDTLKAIEEADKEDEFMGYLEEIYFMEGSESCTITELNDYIRFETEIIFEAMRLNEDGEIPTEEQE
jgi:hypothetical protein